ncbi:hypothetical protein ARMGADRAFT_1090171 [Armillaria gallica]|uniref:Uncharacterized protein n=1 Tax=Armillaria gallica TaxID=47427 RepID=A0A2H3D2P5_ARMGA|nr:hypothetical protein ARMGADRAFT_1090171 [Armillaria gallica]
MENDDAQILAITLGIPSATFLSVALILTVRFCYRPLQRLEVPNAAPTVTTNPPNNPTDDVNAIPLEQLPPRIFAPVPWRPITINNFAGSGIWEEEEIPPELPSPVIPERRAPAPARECTPVITIASPSPPTSDHSLDGGFDVGWDTRPIAPSTTYDPWANRDDAPPPPAGIAPDEFWDNVDLPLSTYFPSNYAILSHRTPSPTGARNLTTWDQPIQNPEYTPEPVRTVEEPIAGPSTLAVPARQSGWQNAPRLREQPQLEGPGTGRWPSEPGTSDTAVGTLPPPRDQPLPSPQPTLMEFPSRPPSQWASVCLPTPIPPMMTLTDTSKFYKETADDLSIGIPNILKRADYSSIYECFANELPFNPRGLPSDDILQYEAERNAHFLWNDLHPKEPKEALPSYEEATIETETQEPMPIELQRYQHDHRHRRRPRLLGVVNQQHP